MTAASAPAVERVAVFADGEAIERQEFERVFRKNAPQGKAQTNADARAYLDLYVGFRRKVKWARAQGLDTAQAFRDELNGYLRQLAANYLTDRTRLDQLVDQAYQRDQLEVTANHILLSCSPDASPADTQRVRQNLLSLRDSALAGTPFGELALRHSQDPSARQNRGHLGSFSALDMVYPFEQAAYTTPVGTLSAPVRTRYGYHLIQVVARGPKGPVRGAAHLYVAVRAGDPSAEQRGRQRIDSLRMQFVQGKSFAELCACCSEDATTSQKGGELGTIRLLPELEGPKRTLSPGQLSEPIRSPYGWHLLRVGDDVAPRPEAERRRELRQRMGRDDRARIAQQVLVQRLMKVYDYRILPEGVTALAQHLMPLANRNLRPGLVDSLPPTLAAQPVARFANQQITSAELLRSKLQQRSLQLYLGDSATLSSIRSQLEVDLGRMTEPRLLAYEEQRLPETNAEYRALADEYRDGLLMFNVMDQRVWRKAVEDSAGQRLFYAAHPDSFISGPRLRYLRMVGPDSAEVALRAAAVQQNPTAAAIEDSLVRIDWAPEPEAIAAARASAERTAPRVRKTATGWLAEALLGELPPARLPFAEAKLDVIRRYQNHLEAELNAELARRYPVSRNESVLSRVAR